MKTETYSPDFSKSLTFGISALVKGKKDYYILEHLVGSNYHTAGEKQEIMLDEVILGRDTDCNVRFDEAFGTVSRHHASITRDGDNWRLTQLSKTNTTFLNGKPLQESWYLQSGDEIQLAVNGPKLIFRIPTDKSGMSFSQRLDSFRDQVIRPYQTAFIVVCCVVLLLIAGAIASGVVIHKISKANKEQRAQIELLIDQLLQTNEQLARTAILADSAQQESIRNQEEIFRERAERIKAQKDGKKVQQQMQQLREEMDSYYNGLRNENVLYEDNGNSSDEWPEQLNEEESRYLDSMMRDFENSKR